MEKQMKPKKQKGFKMNLRTKNCVVCDKPFQWRKKWADCWDEVKYCSDKCRHTYKKAGKDGSTQTGTNFSSLGHIK